MQCCGMVGLSKTYSIYIIQMYNNLNKLAGIIKRIIVHTELRNVTSNTGAKNGKRLDTITLWYYCNLDASLQLQLILGGKH